MSYWLMKSEPSCYSIDDLKKEKIGHWDGVRNYQARNMLRDQMQVGDLAFFYHSNCDVIGIVGIMKIVKAGYPDFTAWDPENEHYDPKSTKENPRWYMVDVALVEKFPEVITLSALKAQPVLSEMQLLQKGNRLSVMPVSDAHWHYIEKLKKDFQ